MSCENMANKANLELKLGVIFSIIVTTDKPYVTNDTKSVAFDKICIYIIWWLFLMDIGI